MLAVLAAVLLGKEMWTFCSTYSQIADLVIALSFLSLLI